MVTRTRVPRCRRGGDELWAKARGVYKGKARVLDAEQLATVGKLIAEGVLKALMTVQLGVDR